MPFQLHIPCRRTLFQIVTSHSHAVKTGLRSLSKVMRAQEGTLGTQKSWKMKHQEEKGGHNKDGRAAETSVTQILMAQGSSGPGPLSANN